MSCFCSLSYLFIQLDVHPIIFSLFFNLIVLSLRIVLSLLIVLSLR